MTQLKTHIFETPKARVLVVGGLPEDARDLKIGSTTFKTYIRWIDFELQLRPIDCIPIEQGDNWQLLGRLHEITEEQWKGIVDSLDSFYREYSSISFDWYDSGDFTETATESGLSLIQSEVLLKNPYEKPDLNKYRRNAYDDDGKLMSSTWIDEFSETDWINEDSNWQAAEDQVYHNPVIFWEPR